MVGEGERAAGLPGHRSSLQSLTDSQELLGRSRLLAALDRNLPDPGSEARCSLSEPQEVQREGSLPLSVSALLPCLEREPTS